MSISAASAAGDPCSGGNAVACENSKPGNPQTEWDIEGAGDDTIQGFATTMSVQPGSTVKFKIKAAASYTVDIYRLGYYGGLGARRQAPHVDRSPTRSSRARARPTRSPRTTTVAPGRSRRSGPCRAPPFPASTSPSSSMGNDVSQITFVVRDDTSHSDVVFKTSDATWQAYNTYGAADFYTAPDGQDRALRPGPSRSATTARSRRAARRRAATSSSATSTRRCASSSATASTSPTRPTSTSSIGTTALTNHKAFMSVGHDEYWTLPERSNVEAARDAGVNLMFLSGNEVYWHTRMEPSIDGSSDAQPHARLLQGQLGDAPSSTRPPRARRRGATRRTARPTAATPRTR